jgi:hypothetical protein
MTHPRGRIVGTAGLVATICVAGCIALSPTPSLPQPIGSAFRDSDEVILYSLAPDTETAGKESFHGFAVHGKTVIQDTSTRKKLFNAFAKGVEDHDGSVAACFIPHHGLRVRSGGKTTDLVICFMCAQVYVYDSESSTKHESILISKSPRGAFDEVLKAGNVPVDKGAE